MFPTLRCHQLAPGRCRECGRQVLLVRRLTLQNHKLHAFLSLLTGGLWIIGWLWCCWRAGERTWECIECGHGNAHRDALPREARPWPAT